MKFRIIVFTICISGFSCSDPCGTDDRVLGDSFKLTEYEKSLVPYNTFTDLSFTNEQDIPITGKTQPREIEIIEEFPESSTCEYWEYENLNNFISFPDLGFSIMLNIDSNLDRTTFDVTYFEDEVSEFFTSFENLTENDVESITASGFEFENVFVFTNQDSGAKVDSILYSAEGNGIELVLFSDGTFLKRE